MTDINQIELNNTLKRIKASLNKRYEKDAEMYISYQDALDIKHHIYNREFESLIDMANSGAIVGTVMSRVFIRNSWLINDDEYDDKILKIVGMCDWGTLAEVKGDIDDNTIEISPRLKRELIKKYYEKAPVDECIDYLDSSEKYDNETLAECFVRTIADIDSTDEKFDSIDMYFETYDVLKKNVNVISEVLTRLKGKKKSEFEAEITKRLTEDLNPSNTMNAYCKAIFLTENRIKNAISIIAGNQFNKNHVNEACKMYRQFIKWSNSEEDIDKELEAIIELYNRSAIVIQHAIANNIFSYQYYDEKVKNKISKKIQQNPRLKENIVERVENSGLTSKTAQGIKDFIHRNPITGIKWYAWIVHNTFLKIPLDKRGPIIVQFILENSNDEYARFIPKIIQTYAGIEAKANKINQGLESLLSLLYDNRNNSLDKYREISRGYIDEEFLTKIEKIVIDTLIKMNCQCGGKNSYFYKYLFDFQREDCKKIYDI